MANSTEITFRFQRIPLTLKVKCCADFDTRIKDCCVIRTCANCGTKVALYQNAPNLVDIDTEQIFNLEDCVNIELFQKACSTMCKICQFNACNTKVK